MARVCYRPRVFSSVPDNANYFFPREKEKSHHFARFRRFPNHGQTGKPLLSNFMTNWSSRMHFATFPVSSLGNWIPRVLSQWYCSGHGCGFDQIVVENMKSNLKTYLFLDVSLSTCFFLPVVFILHPSRYFWCIIWISPVIK